ncbi:MAG: hypothetical protein SVW57_00385, partial [Thermodesulfobacteriota bacterium]|nr:hypothetical protein [Thermodesulfobacteriota bacterium]
QVIAVVSSVCLVSSVALLVSERRYLLVFPVIALSVLFYRYSLHSAFELRTLTNQYGNIVFYEESKYGRVVVTEDQNQYNFFESGQPLFSNLNIVSSEETVHYPLSQLKTVEDILLISGGAGGTIDEILKYKPRSIDYLELDPVLIKAARQYGFIKDQPSLHIIAQDGRAYIHQTPKRYSAIIVDIPDPDTFQLNRFFTDEFYSHTKGILKEYGILSFGLEVSPNYLPKYQKNKLSSIYATVKKYYKNVQVIPGEKAYFLCSDKGISLKIPERLRRKSIETSYILGYFYGNVTKERIALLNQALYGDGDINTDFSPTVMSILFMNWFQKHESSPVYFILIVFVFLIVYLTSLRREEFILFTTGFAAMGTEILIILVFQVIYGYIYLKIGAIITSFLVGLLPGVIIGNRWVYEGREWLIHSEITLSVLLGILCVWIPLWGDTTPQPLFLVYAFLFAFVCGFQFPIAAARIGENKSPAAGCFAADLAGASFGTIITGVVFVPFAGIIMSICFLVLFKVVSIGFGITLSKGSQQ